MKILVIGESPTSFEVFKLLFSSNAQYLYKTCLVEQAEEFITEDQPEIILLDISNQNRNSMELCSRIRTKTKIPIIVLSAMNEPDYIAGLLDCGADDFINKPASIEILNASMNKLIRRVGAPPTSKTQS
jgi:DNA-binding response OmpR family regulator